MKFYALLALSILVSSPKAFAQSSTTTSTPAVGLCNTGLTAANPLPIGCTASVLVTPANPQSGGPSVDGNWQLAVPYPSAAPGVQSPDPCLFSNFVAASVDMPLSGWKLGNGLTQWITPLSETPSAAGWYIYRTPIPVPPAPTGATAYILTVRGNIIADDNAGAIFLGYGKVCKLLSVPAIQFGGDNWSSFDFAVEVIPNTGPYLYVAVYNRPYQPNSTGLQVEFTSAYFTAI